MPEPEMLLEDAPHDKERILLPDIGVIIRNKRAELGLSLIEMAGRTGISKSTLSRLETGKAHIPNSKNLRLLADALGMSVAELTSHGAEDTTPSSEALFVTMCMNALAEDLPNAETWKIQKQTEMMIFLLAKRLIALEDSRTDEVRHLFERFIKIYPVSETGYKWEQRAELANILRDINNEFERNMNLHASLDLKEE